MFGDPIKKDLILISDNVVVADTLGTMIMGIALKRAKHIIIAEKEGIGTTNIKKVRLNTDWKKFKKQFQIRRTLLDIASSLLFHSDTLAKFVMASPFTPLIYKIASIFRSSEEKTIANQLSIYK